MGAGVMTMRGFRSWGKRWGIDLPLAGVLLLLIPYGLVMLYSASWDYSYMNFGSVTQMLVRQLLWLGLGTLALFAFSLVDYHHWEKWAVWLLLGILVTLIAVLIFGEERFFAKRTLFRGSIQPSEMAKLGLVIYLSVWLNAKREVLNDLTFGLIPLSLILALVGGLIYLQPDLSAILTIVFIGGVMFFKSEVSWRQTTILLLATLIIGGLVVQLNDTGRSRMEDFLKGLHDPTTGSYHTLRTIDAVMRGGWVGRGLGNSEAKLTDMPVPPTDSIYAVVGEEMGVIGASVVVILFLLLMWRGLWISRQAPDHLGALLAFGCSTWLVWEAMTNMAGILGLMPFAGNALPFFSAGGSNLVVSLCAIGLLMNVSRQSITTEVEDERLRRTVIHLRRRDRRGRVSRPRHVTGLAKDQA
jgi:cell division protein FtsW